MNLPDRRLAQRMLQGEGEAFDEFFSAHFPGLFRFAMSRMSRDADAAEEVTQAALCKAITKLESYRGEASLFTWLCTFCRHEISAYYRQVRRQPQPAGLADESLEVRGALESLWVVALEDPENAVEREEISDRVHAVLDHLPARYASALEWKYIDGLPVAEIAQRLELGLKAAESVLTRARQAFRDGYASLAAAGRPPIPEPEQG